MTAIAEQIAEISAKANAWCNFAIVCGCIGFVLSVMAATILFINYRKECKNGYSCKH